MKRKGNDSRMCVRKQRGRRIRREEQVVRNAVQIPRFVNAIWKDFSIDSAQDQFYDFIVIIAKGAHQST